MALRDEIVSDIPGRLAELPGWRSEVRGVILGIARDYPAGWDKAAAMVPDIAALAAEMEHRPDIDIRWAGLRVFLVTHTAGDVLTELDLAMAARLDAIAAEHGTPGVLSERGRSTCRTSLAAPRLLGSWRGAGVSGIPLTGDAS